MTAPPLDELRGVWTSRATDCRVGEADRWHLAVLNLLADGQPVDAARLAAVTGGPEATVIARFAQARTAGYEFDDAGRLVGAALTLRPTRHRFRVRGNDLHAWCGFDTLFLPILLDEPAQVTSTCPITGTAIELQVAPDGTISHVSPPPTVIAIVGREVTACCTDTGPDSPVCTQMPFLADPDAADRWQADRPGVAIVPLQDAAQLARAYAGRAT